MNVNGTALGVRMSPAAIVALAAAIAVAGAASLPAFYLVLRALQNAAELWETLSRARAAESTIRTVLLAGSVGMTATVVAVPLAWLLARTDLRLRGPWTVLLSLPLAIPSYVGALAVVAAFGPRGTLQGWLEPLGVERLPEIYGLPGAWLVLTIHTYPFVLLPVRAALASLDRSAEEAARTLGASPAGAFVRVTLPQLRPAIAAGFLLSALYTLSDFGAVSILRYNALSRDIYVQYSAVFDRHAAASLALLLVFVALLTVSLEALTRGRARYHVTTPRGRPRTFALGRLQVAAQAYCLVVASVALLLPVGVLGEWLLRGLDGGIEWQAVREAGVNSVVASALGAGVTTVAALPVAYLAVRHPGPLSFLLERLALSGYALPGIAVALALVFFAANYLPWIYQTLGLLVFGYTVRFLPQAFGPCRASLLQVNPKTEEAARGLGASPWRVFWRITLPQLLPGISAGAALVFLTAMEELPATLLLSPIGYETLAVQVWSEAQAAFYSQAALPALILIMISALPTYLITKGAPAPA